MSRIPLSPALFLYPFRIKDKPTRGERDNFVLKVFVMRTFVPIKSGLRMAPRLRSLGKLGTSRCKHCDARRQGNYVALFQTLTP
jgi:hypothetical protein